MKDSLERNLHYKKGKAELYSEDKIITIADRKAKLEKDKRYILRFTFAETESCYYFEEYRPSAEKKARKKEYILPESELGIENYHSPILERIN